MSRLPWFLPLLWGLLAAVPVRAGMDADSSASPAGQDTVRAGDLIIVGDVVESKEQERDDLKRTLTQLGAGEVPGLRRWQRHKVSTTALYSSAALPGLGCGEEEESVIAPDTTPPAAVTDLAVTAVTESSVTMSWAAPGDDGSWQ